MKKTIMGLCTSLLCCSMMILPAAYAPNEAKNRFFNLITQLKTTGESNPKNLIKTAVAGIDKSLINQLDLSVQDLIDKELIPHLQFGTMDLSNMYIKNLAGLENLQAYQLTRQTPNGQNAASIDYDAMTKEDLESLLNDPITSAFAFASAPASIEFDLKTGGMISLAPDDSEPIKDLILTSNKITTIPQNSFKNLDELTSLRLMQNNITTIASNAFAGLLKLNSLSLSDNAITSLSPGTFDGPDNLLILNLSNNPIMTLPSNIFKNLKHLTHLMLPDSHISKIDSGAFKGLSRLQKLYLERNRLKAINLNPLTDLPARLEGLYFIGNEIDPAEKAVLKEALQRLFPNTDITL